MNWTKTPPTKPGAYWWRQGAKDNEPILAIIERSEEWDGELIDVSSDMPPKDVGGEWSGPLVSVEEVEKAWMEGEAAGWTNANSIPERQVKFEDSRAHKIVQGDQV